MKMLTKESFQVSYPEDSTPLLATLYAFCVFFSPSVTKKIEKKNATGILVGEYPPKFLTVTFPKYGFSLSMPNLNVLTQKMFKL